MLSSRGRVQQDATFDWTTLNSGAVPMPASWKPYPQSPLYTPIVGTDDGSAGSPSIRSNSADIVKIVAGQSGAERNPSQFLPGADTSSVGNFPSGAHPVYFALESDPLFTINQRTGGFSSSWWGTQVRLPQDALPGIGSDAHFVAIQPDGTEWFLYDTAADVSGTPLTALPNGGGTIYGSGFSKHDINGDGIRLGIGTATAAGWGALYGIIRVEEMIAGAINHAIFGTSERCNGTFVAPAVALAANVVATLNGAHNFPMSGGTISYTNMRTDTSGSARLWVSSGTARLPNGSLVTYTGLSGTAASGTLTGCDGGTGTGVTGTIYEHNWPPCGARFQLNMTKAEIDAISDSGNNQGRWWNKVLFNALRRYGMFVGDTGGGNFGFQTLHSFTHYALTGVDRWRAWAGSTNPSMTYNATEDHYEWDFRNTIDWWNKLRVLDWDDPDNH